MLSIRSKDTIVSIVSIVIMGMHIGKIKQSIVFLFCYLPLRGLVGINYNTCIEIHCIKSIFLFLLTILSTEIIDIRFYEELILFFAIIGILGINTLVPVYKKDKKCNDLKVKKNKLIILISILSIISLLLTLSSNEWNEYSLIVSNPILIVYITLIVSIVKEHIIIT